MIEVLKQALEALEKNYKLINGEGTRFGLEGAMDGYYSGCFDVDGTNKETENAITSLRQAIKELESQERNFCPRCGKRTNDIHTCTPPQGIYYTPPQRTWVELEWNDMEDVLKEANGKSMELWEMFKALEAKIKERNT